MVQWHWMMQRCSMLTDPAMQCHQRRLHMPISKMHGSEHACCTLDCMAEHPWLAIIYGLHSTRPHATCYHQTEHSATVMPNHTLNAFAVTSVRCCTCAMHAQNPCAP